MRIVLNGKEIDAEVIINTIEDAPQTKPLEGKTIAYDCGHGGADVGSIGYSGMYEKVYNRRIGDVIISKLVQKGATVIETRHYDNGVSLADRAAIANNFMADIFVSGHHNAHSDPSANGIEIYSYPNSTAGYKLASTIYKYLLPASGLYERGVKQANFQVLRDTNMPATLIEFGFITNQNDEVAIASDDFVELASNAVVDGIIDYFNH